MSKQQFKAKYGYFISRNTLKDVQYWLYWTPIPEPTEACDRFHGEYMPSLQYSQWTYNDTQVLIELRRITSTGGKEGPRRAFTWRSIYEVMAGLHCRHKSPSHMGLVDSWIQSRPSHIYGSLGSIFSVTDVICIINTSRPEWNSHNFLGEV